MPTLREADERRLLRGASRIRVVVIDVDGDRFPGTIHATIQSEVNTVKRSSTRRQAKAAFQ